MYKNVYIISLLLLSIAVTMVVLLALVFLQFLSSNEVEVYRPKLVIDHDGGADDSMAIFMALLYEKYFYGPNVIALTTTHGNVDEDQTYINSQIILDVANRRDVPIYRGSNNSLVFGYPSDHFFGYDGLGDIEDWEYEAIKAQPEHAAFALIELSKTFEGELLVVALGALTNIALAIRLDPKFLSRLSHLYVGAGNIYSDQYPDPEFNAKVDAEAYHVVAEIANSENVTVIPYSQVLSTVNISTTWRIEVLGSIGTKIMQAQNIFERISLNKTTKWSLLDPTAMGVVLNKDIVGEIKYSQNSIILCGNERALNTNNFTEPGEANVEIVYAINQNNLKKLLLNIFSADWLNIKEVAIN